MINSVSYSQKTWGQLGCWILSRICLAAAIPRYFWGVLMVVNDGEILEAAGMLSNPTTHTSLGIWKPRNCSAYINWIAVQSFPQMNTSGSDIIACKLLTVVWKFRKSSGVWWRRQFFWLSGSWCSARHSDKACLLYTSPSPRDCS